MRHTAKQHGKATMHGKHTMKGRRGPAKVRHPAAARGTGPEMQAAPAIQMTEVDLFVPVLEVEELEWEPVEAVEEDEF